MYNIAFHSYFKRRYGTRLINILLLCSIVIQNDVNCVKSGGGSKTISNFAQSRSISGREINTENEHNPGSSSGSGSHGTNSDSENSAHASTSSKFSSVIASPLIMTGNGGSSVFQPSYYEYQHQHQSALNPTPSPLNSYLPQHLQFYSSHYPHSYTYSPESTYSARQLRYSPIPEYLSEAYGGAPLYNSLTAIEKEKDLLSSGSSYHGHGHGWDSDTEEDHSDFGHFGHGHGKGWKKGWKKGKKKHTSHTSHTDYKVSAVNTDGLGLLGLLGLLSLFQLALLALTTTTTTTTTTMAPAPGRRKRSVSDYFPAAQDDTVVVSESDPDAIDSISRIVLPSLNVVAHARNGKIPINCTFQEVCRTNQLIVKNIEVGGAIIGIKITDGIIEMLQFLDKTSDKSLAKLLKDASFKGRMGETCEKHYPTCSALRKPGGLYSLPLLLPISHPYYYNHSQKIKFGKESKSN